jgi:3D (Asp-Asp-Asp) domain-containing protein
MAKFQETTPGRPPRSRPARPRRGARSTWLPLECEDDRWSTLHNGRRPAPRTAVSRYACILCLVTVWLVHAPAKARHGPMTMRATAYTGHGRTASGKRVRRGMVAADPRVLPLGTKVRLKNAGQYSGVYRVEDTGGRIRGRKIDIYMPSRGAAKQFGRQTVKVEVLTAQRRRRPGLFASLVFWRRSVTGSSGRRRSLRR